jgi:uncharacterized membrane protein YhhN
MHPKPSFFMTTPSRTFLILFSLLTALEIVGEMLPNKWLVYGCKPLIMILLMGWIVAQKPDWQRNYPLRWLLVGTVFALLGDVFLMIREVDMFGPGLGSFLLMQVCYIGAFRQEIRGAKQQLSARRLALTLLPFVAYAGVFLLYLDAPFHRTPGTNGLWPPVIFYVVCLCSMAIMAALRPNTGPMSHYQRVLLGAVLFVLSDSAIAVNKFALPFYGASVVIMVTYAAAQYLIVTGVVMASTNK